MDLVEFFADPDPVPRLAPSLAGAGVCAERYELLQFEVYSTPPRANAGQPTLGPTHTTIRDKQQPTYPYKKRRGRRKPSATSLSHLSQHATNRAYSVTGPCAELAPSAPLAAPAASCPAAPARRLLR